MTNFLSEESNQAVDETTDQSALTEETNTSGSQLSEESKTHETEGGDQIDYKAEFERVSKLKEKAENKIVKLKKKEKNRDDDFSDEEESEDLVEKVAQRSAVMLREQQEEWQKEKNQELVDDVLSQISTNSDERDLIQFIYDNKIVRTGMSRQAIIEDLTAAKILANRKKIERENKELSHALKVKSTLNTAPQFSGTKIIHDSEPLLSENEKKFLSTFGQGAVERYKKKFKS